jgi:glycosyltransferase involved in cell wall biosynthesis
MSFGIPTVASDFGGNTEMITPLVNGLLFKKDNPFDLEEKLLKLLSDSELYARLSAGASMVYDKQFSLERMVSEYNALYESFGNLPARIRRA